MSDDEGTGAGGSKAKNIAALVSSIKTTTSAIQTMHTRNDDSSHWNEYTAMAERFLGMVGKTSMAPLLRNMAIRLRKLEAILGIPADRSVTCGVVPGDVVTNPGTDSTSDMTSNAAK
ncbi:hypothetical protein SEMRO_903_G218290.1 [Seminavis robusta]|uniref:Uncharacterized protein n=1 Tax=Seminavis robusta TaxID=568900 RepID=A0A9N8HMJ0_9STRA|nr:hypothetical protein SEMRO_903_G218290.1 [Seminavis robusta]|eukprot:Sro903_g218290.1 n/a (117) ;mRNA; f:25751-26101